jgi:hypothetical protein
MNKKYYISPQMMTEAKFLLKETFCKVSRQVTIDDNTQPVDDDDDDVEGDTYIKGRGMEWGNLW